MERYSRHLASRLARGELGSLVRGISIWHDALVKMFERDWQLSELGPVRFERLIGGHPEKKGAGPACLWRLDLGDAGGADDQKNRNP